MTVEKLGHVEFSEALVAWALHEWQGRWPPLLPESAESRVRRPVRKQLTPTKIAEVA